MTPPTDFDLISFVKDWIVIPAVGIAVWAFKRNEKEHDDLWKAHDSTRKDTSTGHSVLNDKLMEYVDTTIDEVKTEQRRRSDKLAEHIERLFQNAETDRKEFSKVMAEHREDSYKRHIELLHAINAKADR